MAEGKWIPGLTADAPLVDAARQALAVRLGAVGEYLPRAVHESGADPEYVHQLRVSTRRAAAAVRLFAACLPDRVARKARRRLRTLRRAAGGARDGDVFLLGLLARQHDRPEAEQSGLDALVGYALGQRLAAQPALEKAGTRQLADFADFRHATVEAVRDPGPVGRTLLDLARPLLRELLGELEQAVAGDLTDYAHLHRVRIAGKRLRYAMELFAGCFPPSFRDTFYPLIEEMQEHLGLANDSHVAGERLAPLRQLGRTWPDAWSRLEPGFDALLRFHRRRLPQQRGRFVRIWQRWQKADFAQLLD